MKTNLATPKNINKFTRSLERLGNRFPHPIVLFIISSILIVIVSAFLKGTRFMLPGTEDSLQIVSLLNRDGLVYILTHLLSNFKNFPLIPLIVSLTLAIGVGEEAGLYKSLIIKSFNKVKDQHLVFIFFIVSINSNLISDAALILLPQLGAILFLSRNRNPLLGIIISYTGFLAGLSANILIAGTDALVAGVTQSVMGLLPITQELNIHAASNWFFMALSSIILSFIGTLVTEKIVSPILDQKYQKTFKSEESIQALTPMQVKGLKWAGITALVYGLLIILVTLPSQALLRNEITNTILPKSPFMSSIIPLLTFFFLSIGIAYGIGAKTIKSSYDLARGMTNGVKTISGVLIVFFFAAQFVDYFVKTNLATYIAIQGADLFKSLNFTGIPLIILIIIFVAILNFFVGTVGAKWSMMAPILVPMLALLGYHPSFAQAAYRIGDAVTNTINPLSVYIPIILAYMKKYDPDAGVGTVIAYQMPYAMTFFIVWTLQLVIWYVLNLPLGPNSPIML